MEIIGSLMQELPFNDVYSAGWMSSDITLWYLQLLPLWLKILNFFVKCLHENIQYLWFICCPRIFDNFDAQKCILKLEWPLSFSLSISDDRINLILVWRLSLIIFETSGLAVFHGHSPSKYCCSAVWIQKVFNTFNSKLPWKNSPPSCWFISCKLNCVHLTMSIERDGCLFLSLLPSASNDFSALLAEYFSIIY